MANSRERIINTANVGSAAMEVGGMAVGIATLNPILFGVSAGSLWLDKKFWDDRNKPINEKSRLDPARWLWPYIWPENKAGTRMAVAAGAA